jgi:hypothetical protein
MSSVFPATRRDRLSLVFDTWQTGDSFTAPAPGTNAPNTGLLSDVKNMVQIVPVGQGSSTQTIKVLLIGWNSVLVGRTEYWIPIELCSLTCTLGTTYMTVGGETWRFCSGITIDSDKGLEGSSLIVKVAVSAGGVAAVVVDGLCGQKLQFQANKNSSATSANVLAVSY